MADQIPCKNYGKPYPLGCVNSSNGFASRGRDLCASCQRRTNRQIDKEIITQDIAKNQIIRQNARSTVQVNNWKGIEEVLSQENEKRKILSSELEEIRKRSKIIAPNDPMNLEESQKARDEQILSEKQKLLQEQFNAEVANQVKQKIEEEEKKYQKVHDEYKKIYDAYTKVAGEKQIFQQNLNTEVENRVQQKMEEKKNEYQKVIDDYRTLQQNFNTEVQKGVYQEKQNLRQQFDILVQQKMEETQNLQSRLAAEQEKSQQFEKVNEQLQDQLNAPYNLPECVKDALDTIHSDEDPNEASPHRNRKKSDQDRDKKNRNISALHKKKSSTQPAPKQNI